MRYRNGEEFALVAWSPHWMNQRYDLRYLEDPEDALGELNDPATITTIVSEDLPQDDPVATAFMNALLLDEEQIGDIEEPYEYRVSEVFVVEPGADWVVDPVRGRDMVTLQTCTFPDLLNRLIVRADRV